ncbi:arrestin domain-containing protein 3-like [Protopterus annectens]|uniref:arrestin domain-containing protein 3-like n=1 Tax=Protopterus annectens TaxID=7888 RepID=UPI001CFA39C5|nr:arrestin domain-containing protein 3-like [Protopterus annectens]
MGLGKVQEVKICLDRGLDGNVPVYCSGEFVTGKVILVLSGEIKVKYLEIRAKGKAKVRWTETTHTGKRTHTTTYSDEVEFFNIKCILLGQERESDRAVDGPLILSPGQHEYAFSIQIPQSVLVPTFEGEYGSVRYDVKAELHRPWHLVSTSSSDFTIFQHFAVNTPELMVRAITIFYLVVVSLCIFVVLKKSAPERNLYCRS